MFAISGLGLLSLSIFYIIRPASASGPSSNRVLNYQIRLTDPAGIPVIDGTRNIMISFYDDPTGGIRLHTDCGTLGTPLARKVIFTNGIGTVLIGDVSADASHNCSSGSAPNAIPATLFANAGLYLGITVEADAEMTPRKRVVATGYSINADMLDDLETSAVGGTVAFVPVTDTSGNLTLTKDLTVDGSALYVDSTNDSVGINTTLTGLGAKLHVAGEIWSVQNATNPRFVLGDTTGIFGGLRWDSATDTLGLVHGGFGSSATPILSVNSAGNVGIGTTGPMAKLHVSGGVIKAGLSSSNSEGVLILGDGTRTSNYVGLFRSTVISGGSNAYLTAGGEHGIIFTAQNGAVLGTQAERMRIDGTTGNVGIGTTVPITQLHVPGKVPTSATGSVGTGLGPISVSVQGRYAYVANYDGNSIQVIDVSNPATPAVIGTAATGAGPYAVRVQARYAYVVNNTSNTLQVFDVSNPASPVSVGSAATGTGPFSVHVQGRYAYVTNRTSGTFQVFDVSNPAAPVSVGSAAAGTNPVFVHGQDRYAYVVNQNSNTLQVFDVSNPAAPVSVGSAATGAGPYSVHVQGRYAYVTNITADTLQVFDVSNPASPVSVGSVSANNSPAAVHVQGRYAYVANTDAPDTLQVFDVSNPAAPVSVGSVATGNSPAGVHVQGRYAYVVNITPATLQVFDVGGSYIQQFEAGGIETGSLAVRNDLHAMSAAFSGGVTVGQSLNVSGGATIGGALTASGHLLPSVDDAYDLGSTAARWRDLYLGPTSLHVVSTAAETTTARDWKISIQETNGASEGNLRVLEGVSEILNITPAGSVGIGTATPNSRVQITGGVLHVGSGANILGSQEVFEINPSSGNASYLLNRPTVSDYASADWLTGGVIDSGWSQQMAPGDTGLRFVDRAAFQTRLYLQASTGNVGIGTTNPSSFKLQVAGHVGPETDDTFDLGDNTHRWRDLYLGPATLHIGTSTSDEGVITYDTATNKVQIDSTGTVEIGSAMDVNGALTVLGVTSGSTALSVPDGSLIDIGAGHQLSRVSGSGFYFNNAGRFQGQLIVNGAVISQGTYQSTGNVGITIQSSRNDSISSGTGAPYSLRIGQNQARTVAGQKLIGIFNDSAAYTTEVAHIDSNGYYNGGITVAGAVSVSALATPVNATHTVAAGTLPPDTYSYRVSATNANGETLASAQTSIALGATGGVNVNWNSVMGATGYKIYGRTAGGQLLLGTVTGTGILTFLDDGSLTPSGALPAANSTAGVFGDLNVDSGTLFVDSVNNRVGIGTTSPTELLDIFSSTTQAALTLKSTAGSGHAKLNLDRVTGNTEAVINYRTAGTQNWRLGLANNTANDFRLMHESTSEPALYVTDAARNVGIGVDNPANKLQVQGAATSGTGTLTTSGTTTVTGTGTAFTTQLQVGDTIVASSQSRRVVTIASATSLTVETAFSPDLAASSFTFSRPRFVVQVTGNVGIGTTAPSRRLEIAHGTSGFGGGYGFTTGPIVTGDTGIFEGSLGYQFTKSSSTFGNVSGFLRGSTNSGGSFNGMEVGTNSAFPLRFITNSLCTGAGGACTENERMRISTRGDVGIGTSARLSRLTVTPEADTTNLGGTTTANASTTVTGISTTFLTSLGIGDRISLSSAPSTYAVVTAIASNTSLTVDAALGNGTSQTINKKQGIFRLSDVSAATKLLVNDLGRVGIGTEAPNSLLHLNAASGAIELRMTGQGSGTATSDGSFFSLSGAIAPNDQNLQIVQNENRSIEFHTNANGGPNERMRIDAAGNVGIGTASPQNKLDVEGGAVVGAAYSGTNAAPANGLLIEGNVGVGVTSPGAKMDIEAGTLTPSIRALQVKGILPDASLSGVNFEITSAGTGGAVQRAFIGQLLSGYTGSGRTVAFEVANSAAGTGTDIYNLNANFGFAGSAIANTSGSNAGAFANAEGGDINVGFFGRATFAKNNAQNVGVMGLARNTGSSPIELGGYFGLNTGNPSFASAALIADNAATTSPIFLARDNGTAVFSIIDGGNVGIGTASPGTFDSEKLAVVNTSSGAGTVALNLINNATTAGTAVALDFTPNNNVPLAKINAVRTDTGGAGTTDFALSNYRGSTTTLTETLRIKGDTGHVGIGTPGPGSALHVLTANSSTDGLTIERTGFSTLGRLQISQNADPTDTLSVVLGGTFLFDFGADGDFEVKNGNIMTDLTQTATTNGVCHSGANSDTTASDRFLVVCSGAPGDIAEWYDTDDAQPGDIVVPTDRTITYESEKVDALTGEILPEKETLEAAVFARSTAPYQGGLFGVVSSSPVQTIGKAMISSAAHPQPIALAGRVKVRVTGENGAIRPGDPITSSSTSGAGMKATGPGMVVGFSLGTHEGTEEGAVLLYVNPGWWNGSQVQGGSELTATDSDLDMKRFGIVEIGFLRGVGDLWSIDETGKLTAKDIAADTITAKNFTVRKTDERKTIGEATIVSGEAYVQVHDAAITPSSKVFITFRKNPRTFWWIDEVMEGLFIVKTDAPMTEDTVFDYWIVAVADETTPVVDDEIAPVVADETMPVLQPDPEPIPEPVVEPVPEPTPAPEPSEEGAPE